MYIVSEIIAVIAEIALVHLYMKDSFPTKDHPWWIYGVFYTIFGGILVYLSFCLTPHLSDCFSAFSFSF